MGQLAGNCRTCGSPKWIIKPVSGLLPLLMPWSPERPAGNPFNKEHVAIVCEYCDRIRPS